MHPSVENAGLGYAVPCGDGSVDHSRGITFSQTADRGFPPRPTRSEANRLTYYDNLHSDYQRNLHIFLAPAIFAACWARGIRVSAAQMRSLLRILLFDKSISNWPGRRLMAAIRLLTTDYLLICESNPLINTPQLVAPFKVQSVVKPSIYEEFTRKLHIPDILREHLQTCSMFSRF